VCFNVIYAWRFFLVNKVAVVLDSTWNNPLLDLSSNADSVSSLSVKIAHPASSNLTVNSANLAAPAELALFLNLAV
jgi:hypothetical protein